MHLQEGKKIKILFFIFLLIFFSSINNKLFMEKKNSMMKINEIKISGLSDDEKTNLIQQLKEIFFKNIFLISQKNFTNILNKNNLIQSFSVKKKYPNSILINIKKADFLAITNIKNKKYLVGSNGKLIDYHSINNHEKKLPFIFGKVDYSDFIYFKKIVDKSEFNYENITSLYHFPNNRWDVKTKNGILIKLPEENFFNALNFANKVIYNNKFNANKVIDLRISNHMIILNE
tara:strand:- start:1171 stop:1866 length:696 start_codon:yes stop_codon:yes gene_type:complete